MATEKKEKDARQEAWDIVLERVKAANPAAYEARKATGEFDSIPDSFDPKNFNL